MNRQAVEEIRDFRRQKDKGMIRFDETDKMMISRRG